YYRGAPVEANLLPKIQVDIVVSKVPARAVIETAKKVLYTGHIGDGKIFVYDVENVVKVRTGEEGYAALQDVESETPAHLHKENRQDPNGSAGFCHVPLGLSQACLFQKRLVQLLGAGGVGGVEDNGAAVGLQDHASAAGGEGIAGVIAVEVVFKAAQGHLEIAQAVGAEAGGVLGGVLVEVFHRGDAAVGDGQVPPAGGVHGEGIRPIDILDVPGEQGPGQESAERQDQRRNQDNIPGLDGAFLHLALRHLALVEAVGVSGGQNHHRRQDDKPKEDH